MKGMFEGRWTPVKGVPGASGKRGAGVAHGRRRRVKGDRDAGTAAGSCNARAPELGGGCVHGVEASRSAKRTLDAPSGKYPVGQGSAVVAVDPGTPPVPAAFASRRAPDRRTLPPGEGGGPGAGPRLRNARAASRAHGLIRPRAPCRRRCAGTARGVRPGRGARPRGRSPRSRRRRAVRSRGRA